MTSTFGSLIQMLQVDSPIWLTACFGIKTVPKINFSESWGVKGRLGADVWPDIDNSLKMRLKGLSAKL
jgi:hypothetical protein